MRTGMTVLVTILTLGWAIDASAQAKYYVYELDGKTWFGNQCPRRARKCRVIMKGGPLSSQKTEPVDNGVAKKKRARADRARKKSTSKWKPPEKKVVYNERTKVENDKETELDDIIQRASTTYNLPEAFIRAVISVESSYKIKALSYKGAMGLMQLMPGTAADMGVTDAYDPYQNVMGGTKFLRILANRFNGDIPKVLAAFHAGGRAVAVRGGIPFEGSDGYVRKVLANYYRLKVEFAANK